MAAPRAKAKPLEKGKLNSLLEPFCAFSESKVRLGQVIKTCRESKAMLDDFMSFVLRKAHKVI